MKPPPLTDADIARLQQLLDAVPAPLEPLDAMALDGFVCGVALQPQPVPPPRWLRYVTDVEGRELPPGFAAAELHALAGRRFAEVDEAVAQRRWFDPWVYALDDEATPSQAVLPWVAGFAAAMELFPGVMRRDDPALLEPLALLYRHLDPEDLEDADELLALIETLESAEGLAEAVEDIVRSVLLIADVTRPRGAPHALSRRGRQGFRR